MSVSSTRCGLRGGYVELVNLDPAVMKYIDTLFSKESSTPILGQIALDLMTDPPKPEDPSYLLYNQVGDTATLCGAVAVFDKECAIFLGFNFFLSCVQRKLVCFLQEKEHIRTLLVQNSKRMHEVFNSLPGCSCSPIEGGLFAFPRLYLTAKAIQKAKVTKIT